MLPVSVALVVFHTDLHTSTHTQTASLLAAVVELADIAACSTFEKYIAGLGLGACVAYRCLHHQGRWYVRQL